MKTKKISVIVSSAVLLLALLFPPTAKGQLDSEYGTTWGDTEGGATLLGFENGDTEGGATLLGFENGDTEGGATLLGFDRGDAPLGGGLLVLALSGVCYAGAKRLKSRK